MDKRMGEVDKVIASPGEYAKNREKDLYFIKD